MFISSFLRVLIRLYQIVSRLLHKPACCRYYPSCSEYALIVLKENYLPKALFLIAKRILRCNPFFEGGIDLPPTPKVSENKVKP